MSQCKRQLDEIRKYKKYTTTGSRSFFRRYWIYLAAAALAPALYFGWQKIPKGAAVSYDGFIDSVEAIPKDTLNVPIVPDRKDTGNHSSKTDWTQNFVENPNVEKLVHLPSKSDQETVVSSPPPGATFTNHLVFSWQSVDSSSIFVVTILNNHNQEVWTSQTQRHTLAYNGNLDPGLYYWKLIKQGRLLYIDKILKKVSQE